MIVPAVVASASANAPVYKEGPEDRGEATWDAAADGDEEPGLFSPRRKFWRLASGLVEDLPAPLLLRARQESKDAEVTLLRRALSLVIVFTIQALQYVFNLCWHTCCCFRCRHCCCCCCCCQSCCCQSCCCYSIVVVGDFAPNE